jgi:hypothetical protein
VVAARTEDGEKSMMDILFLAATVVFFAAGIAYVYGCERLK